MVDARIMVATLRTVNGLQLKIRQLGESIRAKMALSFVIRQYCLYTSIRTLSDWIARPTKVANF